jgi:predicted ATPase
MAWGKSWHIPRYWPNTARRRGLEEKAVSYWLKAGQQALSRSAMVEAVAQLRQGLRMLASLPDG